MLADDMTVGFELLEILADRDFGNAERFGQAAHARAAFFLKPFENLVPARLTEHPRPPLTAHACAARQAASRETTWLNDSDIPAPAYLPDLAPIRDHSDPLP